MPILSKIVIEDAIIVIRLVVLGNTPRLIGTDTSKTISEIATVINPLVPELR